MAVVHINNNVHVKSTSEKGLGLFATVCLSPGLKIVDEKILLSFHTRQDAVNEIASAYDGLDDEVKSLFKSFYWTPLDLRTRFNGAEHHGVENMTQHRLQQIVQHNGIEGQGAGYVISTASSAINHE
jgi:hypothetical protein